MGGGSTKHPDFQTQEERRASLNGQRRTPRILIIGAGQRGTAYASAIVRDQLGAQVAAVAEPVESRRRAFGARYVWGNGNGNGNGNGTGPNAGLPREDQEFDSWADFVAYETRRRELETAGERTFPGVDGAFVCTQDGTHRDVVTALAPLKLHVMCEKPLAGNLDDCRAIYASYYGSGGDGKDALSPSPSPSPPDVLFSIGHVLRYSPHNRMLRRLLLRDKAVGEVVSVEHTEPVGWWHFSHSYVRGNWRRQDVSGPSLLTKSCHDIDLLLWLLCYRSDVGAAPHMPSDVSSLGNLAYFTKRRKPKAAGAATNCLSCAHEPDCNYSAKKIYLEKKFDKGIYGWPNDVLVPDIEDVVSAQGVDDARRQVEEVLSRDYDASTPGEEIKSKQWYGRCVWEGDNDVLDDQFVTLRWDEDPAAAARDDGEYKDDRGPKTAMLHMVANTEKQCERRGKISGTAGEIIYDSYRITVHDFATDSYQEHIPKRPGGGHGGGDSGLAEQFVTAVAQVINGDMAVQEAQARYIGCTLEEAFMSHAMVFAAEESRTERKVVDWQSWWKNLLQSA